MRGRIGIRRENIDITEKRAPLTPRHVQMLIRDHDLEVLVRPSPHRFFPEAAYQQAGAIISDDLSTCNIIFGVKEIPQEVFMPNHAYCFFSHTIKGQPHNMPMLRHILELRCSLLDYERVTDERDKRLIAFGPFAGYAGMIDSLWVFGQRLRWEGIETPFAMLQQANRYANLRAAQEAISELAERIRQDGLPAAICPLICGFTGSGNVSRGAQAIYDMLQPHVVKPRDLQRLIESSDYDRHAVYKVVFGRNDRVRPKDPARPFDPQEYLEYPERYTNGFTDHLPALSLLINGIYWEEGYPRLVHKQELRALFEREGRPRLRVVGDITNDIGGSIEFNVKATTSANPVYVYEPAHDRAIDGWEGAGPVVLAVDKLPSELPAEASEAFGDALLPFVPALAHADYSLPFTALELPPPFKKAVIAHRGELMPGYHHLLEHLRTHAG